QLRRLCDDALICLWCVRDKLTKGRRGGENQYRSKKDRRKKCFLLTFYSPVNEFPALQRNSAPAAPTPAWRLRGVEIDAPAVDQDHLDGRLLGEQIALGHDDVGDLAFLERAEPVRGAGDTRRVEGQGADGSLRGQSFLDGARRVFHEVRSVRQAGR